MQPTLRRLKSSEECELPSRRRPGRPPKPISQRKPPPLRIVQRVQRSYSRERKLSVLSFLYHYKVAIFDQEGRPTGTSRPIQIEEVSQLVKIPRSTISTWKKEEAKIIDTPKNRRSQRSTILCYWPELEKALYKEFIKRREEGRLVRRGWFRRTARRLFTEHYPHIPGSLFCFSAGWFTRFLRRFHISLRFTTNQAQKLPQDYVSLIQSWLQFNRRHSQPRPQFYMETVLASEIGRYMLKNICNLDETPICFEYLTGRTYSLKGLKTIWAKATKSGWSKRQATLILCVFADGIARIPPVIIFHGKGSARMNAERQLYDPRVIVDFNPTAWNNEQLFLRYIDRYLSRI